MHTTEKQNTILAFRHLKDSDSIKSNLLDGPIEEGQEELAETIASEILSFARKNDFKKVKILFSDQRRSSESVELVKGVLKRYIPVSTEPHSGLREIDQGVPKLPVGYNDGDFLPALPSAWEAFGEEAYEKRNFSYHFGDPNGATTHKSLVDAFEKTGENLEEFLPRHYAFLKELFAGELQKEDELLVLCAHSTTMLILLECDEIARDLQSGRLGYISPEDFPVLCWKYYKEKIEPNRPKDFPFGHIMEFDISNVKTSGLIKIINQSQQYFTDRKNAPSASIQCIINRTSNDYSKEDEKFLAATEKHIDSTENLSSEDYFAPVSVIIPYYHSKNTIRDVLTAIEQQNLSKENLKRVEVIISDDGSHDGIEEFVDPTKYTFELKVLLSEENTGRAGARNRGAQAAQNDILLFVDSDILLGKNCLLEHVARNVIAPDQLYTSLISRVDPEYVENVLRPHFNSSEGLPNPPEYIDEYRSYKLIEAGKIGIYPVEQDVEVEILKETDNFKSFGFGRRMVLYDLPCMFATYLVSLKKNIFEKIGGFSEEFKGWGLEDTFFGAVGITKGAKIIPILSCGVYSINHPPRSGSQEKKNKELAENVKRYQKMVTKA